jgi:biopolymer transport protein ExbD
MEPKPGKEDIATPKDYHHCVDLTQHDYVIVVNGVKHSLPNIKELSSFIKSNKKLIIKQKISIVSGSETSYEKIVNVLDLFTELGINNYKLVTADGKFPSTSPIIIQSSKPFPKDIDLNDSTVMIISVSTDSLTVSLLSKSFPQSGLPALDKFLSDNKKNTDPDKIVIAGQGNSHYDQIEQIISLLKKYGYYKYHLIAKD